MTDSLKVQSALEVESRPLVDGAVVENSMFVPARASPKFAALLASTEKDTTAFGLKMSQMVETPGFDEESRVFLVEARSRRTYSESAVPSHRALTTPERLRHNTVTNESATTPRRRRTHVPSLTSTSSHSTNFSAASNDARVRKETSIHASLDDGMAVLQRWIRSKRQRNAWHNVDGDAPRQRAMSEPAVALSAPPRIQRWNDDNLAAPGENDDTPHLSVLEGPNEAQDGSLPTSNSLSIDSAGLGTTDAPVPVLQPQELSSIPSFGDDEQRRARLRWIQINRRFQVVITAVALIFSLLLFAILICWIALASSYALTFDKACDLQLRPYFWLVSFQMVLDVFRSDILRFFFRWQSSSEERMPRSVVVYNLAYLLYAVLVLRMGIRNTYAAEEDNFCSETAPQLYNSSVAFVSLSLAAWGTILFGYLLPFCVVAALLTFNGYSPSEDVHSVGESTHPVFPAAYTNTGAPAGTIDSLSELAPSEIPTSGARECCICMEDFDADDAVVETGCKHLFHKSCCREWLRQARTCPVCRCDIPSMLGAQGDDASSVSRPTTGIPIGPTGRPVVGLLRILSRDSFSEGARRSRTTSHASRDELYGLDHMEAATASDQEL